MDKEIPEGHVALEVIIAKDGTYETKIIGHGKNTACSNGEDDIVLDGMVDGIGKTTDYGHTEEHYQERRKKMSNPSQGISLDTMEISKQKEKLLNNN